MNAHLIENNIERIFIMAKIQDSKGRSDENSGYARLFGNQNLGQLMSRVQAAVIRTGNELEHILEQETPDNLKSDLGYIFDNKEKLSDIYVVFQAKMPKKGDKRGETADIVIINGQSKTAMIIELKDGDTFDTKKASGELESMKIFADWLKTELGYETNYYFCSFNQNDKNAITVGAKGRFNITHAMTGKELCDIIKVNYEVIKEKRQKEQPENLRYFITELLNIDEVVKIISEIWKK